MKNVFILLAVLCLTNGASAQPKPKRKLIFSDEFNYSGLPDPKKWNYETGFVRNKEPQYYTRGRMENARVENGMLVIEAKKEEMIFNGRKGNDTARYTSASITTLGRRHFRYGRIEVRAKVPKGTGAWSAIWMLGENRETVKWPQCGEIDIMEFVGKDSSKVYGTVHYADSTGQYKSQGLKPEMGAPYEDFHLYAIEWDKDKIEFYYDDTKYFAFPLEKANRKEDNIFRKKFYLLLNLALGREGTLGGRLDDSILPLKYYVDYVRVYK